MCGGGGSFLLSDVLLESGGEIKPDLGPSGPCQEVYGGGGAEYIDVGLTTAVVAIEYDEEYDRSVLIRSVLSWLIRNWRLLRGDKILAFRARRAVKRS